MKRGDGMPAANEDRDDLVVDAADALSLNQRVQWARYEKLATPASRRALDNLRVLAGALAGAAAAGEAPTTHGVQTRAGAFWRRAAQALIAIAAVEVTATLVLLPWAWGDYRREHGELAVYMATKLVGHAAGACLLLVAGRRDRRTWLLGVYCLLKATLAPPHMLAGFFLEIPPPQASARSPGRSRARSSAAADRPPSCWRAPTRTPRRSRRRTRRPRRLLLERGGPYRPGGRDCQRWRGRGRQAGQHRERPRVAGQ